MTRRVMPRQPRSQKPTPVFADEGLAELGLCPGDRVRFRRRDDDHWTYGTVVRRERDGSVGLHDRDGKARAITTDRLEMATTGPRGGLLWASLARRQNDDQQLRLL